MMPFKEIGTSRAARVSRSSRVWTDACTAAGCGCGCHACDCAWRVIGAGGTLMLAMAYQEQLLRETLLKVEVKDTRHIHTHTYTHTYTRTCEHVNAWLPLLLPAVACAQNACPNVRQRSRGHHTHPSAWTPHSPVRVWHTCAVAGYGPRCRGGCTCPG